MKRLPYILKLLEEDKTEAVFYINHRKEKIEIDKDVEVIVHILNEIIEREEPNEWLSEVLQKFKDGDKDVFIIMDSPVSRAKYYILKERLINKIYDCCIYKGLVTYEDILSEEIG